MAKRKFDNEDFFRDNIKVKTAKKYEVNVKKHSLDSDEEDDNDDRDNVLAEEEIEGEEDGVAREEGEVRMTAFNMNEEMELGHFDKQGHFIWKNEKEVRDNWLDNIDWQKIKQNSKFSESDGKIKGLGEESDSDDDGEKLDVIGIYEKILAFMKPKENINKALRRLGGDISKLSSIERLKRKKAGTLQNSAEVTALTELANQILNTGNMDIYQETYEQISLKLDNNKKKKSSKAGIVEAETDMFGDTFEEPGQKVEEPGPSQPITEEDDKKANSNDMMWEFKWDQNSDKVEGPYNTKQMLKWSEEGYFKTGVWVKKLSGEDSNFYSSNRIDFDLYL